MMLNRIAILTISDNEKSIEIKDLNIIFEIEKTLAGHPGVATIQIVNISSQTIQKIKKLSSLVLQVGYENNELSTLFQGQITNFSYDPGTGSTETFLTIYAVDGGVNFFDSEINKTLSAGSTVGQVFNELVGEMKGITKGITSGISECLKKKRSLLRSLQLAGNIKKLLDDLANDCGFDYAVSNNTIDVTPKGLPIDDESSIIVNAKTGMIGSPEKIEQGIELKHLITPNIASAKVGRKINIETISGKINIGNMHHRKLEDNKDISGIYRIEKLKYSGSTHDQQWECSIVGRVF